METRAHRGRFLIIAVMLACIPSDLWAHGTVGKRKFIEPLFTEDANIKRRIGFATRRVPYVARWEFP